MSWLEFFEKSSELDQALIYLFHKVVSEPFSPFQLFSNSFQLYHWRRERGERTRREEEEEEEERKWEGGGRRKKHD